MTINLDALKEKGRRLRIHCLKATSEAGSGHPSSCLSAADLTAIIFFHEMHFDPKDPQNPANDRFILSKGHAAPLLWAAYAEAGTIAEQDLLTLRRIDSDLEGHPTPRMPWVDVATGSLGQGLSVGLGNALAARLDRLPFNTYVLLGDGECAEGSVWEAAALSGHYKTSNLFAVIDVNGLGQSQRTMEEFNVNGLAEKFRAFGWFVQTADGHDYEQILSAFEEFRRAATPAHNPKLWSRERSRARAFRCSKTRMAGTEKPYPNRTCLKLWPSSLSHLGLTDSRRSPGPAILFQNRSLSRISSSTAPSATWLRHARRTATRSSS
jgi:transketolase N-terminal domain/subunit